MANFLPLILVFVIMYFFFLRPQMKKQKEQNNFLANVKKGDQVATGSGIIGRINKFEEEVVELQLDSKTFIKILKNAISKEATESLKNKNYLD
ncbi:MAG: preprotein translocase subunit YajC [Saprospiraceae bacterium]|nr:preprotein translocase subunit YajC [Saprospiraceae bacterium]